MPKRGTSPVTAAAGSPSITKLPLTEPKKKITRWLAGGNESTILAARADVQVRCYGRLICPLSQHPSRWPFKVKARQMFRQGRGRNIERFVLMIFLSRQLDLCKRKG